MASVRAATHVDIPALGRLGALLVRTHHDFDRERFIPASPRTEHGYASWLGSQLENPEAVILVAVQMGEVLGYSYSGIEGPDYMSLRGPAGVLHDIVVDPAHRREGVGRMVLDATLEALALRGAPQVVLWTAARNEAAQRLFAGARVPADDVRDVAQARWMSCLGQDATVGSVNGGASLVKRGGDAYEGLEDKTDVGGVVGATLGFNLGGFLSFYVAAEDYIYGTTFVESGTLEEKRTQNDVQLALGFGVPLNR